MLLRFLSQNLRGVSTTRHGAVFFYKYFLSYNVIPEPASETSNLSLKIEYDTRTGKAYMYDGKYREDVSFYMNNFKL